MGDEKLVSTIDSAARFGPTVLAGSADDAVARLEKPNEPLWYIAYGSNLASSVFKGRRRVKPIDERHVLVEDLELVFDLPGLPYLEPRFANCRLASPPIADGSEEFSSGCLTERMVRKDCGVVDLNGPWTGKGALIGVAYLVSPVDFARITKTEGGGSGYRMVSVEAQVFKRKDKFGEEENRFEISGETVHAYTLLAPKKSTRSSPGSPSTRYLRLIRQGAEEHNLPSRYRAYLASLKPYTPRTVLQKLGAVVCVVVFAPPILLVTLLGFALAREDGSYPPWLNAARDRAVAWMWSTYDKRLRLLFGDGEGRTIHEK